MSRTNMGLFTRLKEFKGVSFAQKRYRYKKKWAEHKRQKTAPELALEHFDLYYKPVYGKLWPSIRISLLSPQKYSALVNNFFSKTENTLNDLKTLGCYDFMNQARKTDLSRSEDVVEDVNSHLESHMFNQHDGQREFKESSVHQTIEDVSERGRSQTLEHFSTSEIDRNVSGDTTSSDSEVISPEQPSSNHGNLYDFVPVQRVYSDKDLLRQEEMVQSVYEPRDVNITRIPDEEMTIPEHLKVCVFPRGDVSEFPSPKPDEADILGYYLMDAASILPVVALNPKPDDRVLDLCAAPGGKTLTLLQTLTTGDVVAVDKSYARIQRLRDVMRWYCAGVDQKVKTIHGDGCTFSQSMFDKVLVDVPCSTDRHVLVEEDNNLFRPGRITERLELPSIQKSLLIAGIKSCKPGGTVVYSTCSLSPPQNDGVIQAALEDIWENTRIDVAVQDISWISLAFCKTFRFFEECRFGQQVLPTLSANFGPMYVCKIKRLN